MERFPLAAADRAAEEARSTQIGLGNFSTQLPMHYRAILASAVMARLPVVVPFRLFQRYGVLKHAREGIEQDTEGRNQPKNPVTRALYFP